MKKQQVRRKAAKKKNPIYIPVGVVWTELILWDFSGNDEVIAHNASELARAIYLNYGLNNFGPKSFGIDDEIT